MQLSLSAPQCLFLGIIAFGLLGFIQGWRRAVILTAFTLAGFLFLNLGGGKGVADLIFVRAPVIWQESFAPNAGGHVTTPNAPDSNTIFLTTLITFLVIVAIGYLVGQRAFDTKSSAGTPFGRIMGILPGLVTGYFFMTYLADIFGSSVSFGINTPTSNVLDDSVPILFLVGVIVLILGLISTRVRRSGSKK